jgi:erythromycin esterase-like protein
MAVALRELRSAIRADAIALTGAVNDYDALVDRVGDARFVLIGEATHGTHEFYSERAAITRRLIREKGFMAVAAEADWPDAYRINRFVLGDPNIPHAIAALEGFIRFPSWMWRNTVVLDFVDWLRQYNASVEKKARAGFYGLDLYSMYKSMEAVIQYLSKVDPEAARRARYRYSCFEQFHESTEAYGYHAGYGLTPACEQEAVSQLVELQRRASELANRDGHVPEDEFFFAEQNARLVKNAEQYYRTMFQGHVASWNLRDRHMAETLEFLAAHLERKAGRRARIVVWEHNSHLGDARATEMGRAGEWNVGQLVRERHGRESLLVGFTTYGGTVTAASDWDGPAATRRVRDALPESYEAVLHDAGLPEYMLVMARGAEAAQALAEPRLERAIGVVYRPETERASHYFEAALPEQFDVVIHLDKTRALEPLERLSALSNGEQPETYPEGE